MAQNLQPLFESVMSGSGLFTLSDAAFYAKIPRQTLADWFFGKKGQSPIREARFREEEEKFLTFDEFIEGLAIRSLRQQHDFRLRDIFNALAFAETQYGVEYLFSNPRHRVVIDSAKCLHFYLDSTDHPIQLSGKKFQGQQSFTPLIQDYLKFIEVDNTGRAIVYRPKKFFGKQIAMIPSFSFGDPIVEDVHLPVRTLAESAKAEKSTARTADLFEIDEDSVKAAVAYWKYLTTEGIQQAA